MVNPFYRAAALAASTPMTTTPFWIQQACEIINSTPPRDILSRLLSLNIAPEEFSVEAIALVIDRIACSAEDFVGIIRESAAHCFKGFTEKSQFLQIAFQNQKLSYYLKEEGHRYHFCTACAEIDLQATINIIDIFDISPLSKCALAELHAKRNPEVILLNINELIEKSNQDAIMRIIAICAGASFDVTARLIDKIGIDQAQWEQIQELYLDASFRALRIDPIARAYVPDGSFGSFSDSVPRASPYHFQSDTFKEKQVSAAVTDRSISASRAPVAAFPETYLEIIEVALQRGTIENLVPALMKAGFPPKNIQPEKLYFLIEQLRTFCFTETEIPNAFNIVLYQLGVLISQRIADASDDEKRAFDRFSLSYFLRDSDERKTLFRACLETNFDETFRNRVWYALSTVEIASECVQFNLEKTIQNIQILIPSVPKDRPIEDQIRQRDVIEMAKICAKKDGLLTARHITRFGIDNERFAEDWLAIYSLCRAQAGSDKAAGDEIDSLFLTPAKVNSAEDDAQLLDFMESFYDDDDYPDDLSDIDD